MHKRTRSAGSRTAAEKEGGMHACITNASVQEQGRPDGRGHDVVPDQEQTGFDPGHLSPPEAPEKGTAACQRGRTGDR